MRQLLFIITNNITCLSGMRNMSKIRMRELMCPILERDLTFISNSHKLIIENQED